MGTVATLATATDWRLELAAKLEDAAAKLRSGELIADQGVLVLRNLAGGLMHAPIRLGAPSSPVEVLGMLAYAQLHHFETDVAE